ncbi:cytosine permease [Sphaerisporangium sp. TRM90804]|uniref:purine-cytosine permease family protein n=1 Tax=Sphaerisporangium sp. TRM90804 TaxID=3031113 RepID=UPI00244A5498|nr:cytosine permease [Sphaerisporangium sp. TRM90804]MDH2424997.1 cytosine permease [Sphaerisporangium sp. TRM90804]
MPDSAVQPPGVKLGHDDYALERVPPSARYGWWTVAVQRFGMLSALSQFLLGATLGMGMRFWDAVLAITLGAVILEVVAIAVGVAGMREGLSTTVLARWAGFGRYGAGVVGVVVAVALLGWFGVQSAVLASGLSSLLGGPPVWVWSVLAGLVVTAVVVHGFRGMAWLAWITVPAFLVLAGWAITVELSKQSLSALVASAPPGPPLDLAQATTLVAGGFIVGAVISPDMCRMNRSVADVVKQTVLGITLGEYVIALVGVLLAHALRTGDVIAIVTTTSGAVGTLVLVTATLKINDWNLYSAGLGMTNTLETAFGVRVSRPLVTVVLGAVGTTLAAAGILDHLIDFLVLLGVAIPPVAGIMVAEYYVVRRWRPALEESRRTGTLPASAPAVVPAALVVWLGAALVGKFVTWGVPALNALAVAFVAYVAAGRAGLIAADRPSVPEGADTPAAR